MNLVAVKEFNLYFLSFKNSLVQHTPSGVEQFALKFSIHLNLCAFWGAWPNDIDSCSTECLLLVALNF